MEQSKGPGGDLKPEKKKKEKEKKKTCQQFSLGF